MNSFKLIAASEHHQKESEVEAQIMRYLYTLRVQLIQAWKNEEFPRPGGKRYRESVFRRLGSDIYGIIQHQGGRWMTIEVKTKLEFEYLMRNYETIKNYFGPNKKKTHLRDQIEFVEMINKHGGIAFFACSWLEVQERLRLEGIDRAK
jgi:hypothetical protein